MQGAQAGERTGSDPGRSSPRVSGSAAKRRGRRLVQASACLGGLAGGVALLVLGLTPPPPPPAPLPRTTFTLAAGSVKTAPLKVVPAGAQTPAGPDRLVVTSLGIDAPLIPQDVDGGHLVIPGDPDTVGLWRGGAPVDARSGTTLLAGHVDKHGELGALHELYRVTPGTRIVVTDGRGRPSTWAVVSLQVRAKSQLPTFTASGPRRLAVVTCGGQVVHSSTGTGYADNVIVLAEPVGVRTPRG